MNTRPRDAGWGATAWAGLVAGLLVAGAATSLGSVFADTLWRGPILTTIAVVVAAATAGRLARLHPVVSIVAAWGTGAVWIMATWPLTAGLPWRARPAAVRRGFDLAGQDLVAQVAPTPSLPGLVLVAMAGAALVAGITTVFIHHRAVGPAVVAALVLWAAPLAVPVPVPAGATAALWLVVPAALALATLGPGRVRLGLQAQALGVAAVAVALSIVAAPLVPWFTSPPLLDVRNLGLEATGSQPIVDVGDQLRLPAARPVLLVSTDTPYYLRTAALEVFDGTTWRVGTSMGDVALPDDFEDAATSIRQPDPARAQDGTWSVNIVGLPSPFLPVVNQTRAVTSSGSTSIDWSDVGEFATVEDLDALVDEEPTGPDYLVDAAVPTPDMARLRAAGVADAADHLFELPPGQDEVVQQARDLVEAAGATSAIDQIMVLQDWFAGPDSEFAYDLDTPDLRGTSALRDFVLETKVGYCEYYATAMAVMLRGLGIPARVATGYLPGALAAESAQGPNLYQVDTTDAHAWVEVAFEEHGWVTLDPTPRADTSTLRPGRGYLTTFAPVQRSTGTPRGVPPEDDPRQEIEASPEPQPVDNAGATPGGGADNSTRRTWWALGAVALLGGAGVLLVLRRRDLRGRSGLDPATTRVVAARDHLLAAAARLDAGRRPTETLHELVARWQSMTGLSRPDIDHVATVGARVAYSSTPVSDEDARGMEAAAAAVRARLRARATRPRALWDRLAERLVG